MGLPAKRERRKALVRLPEEGRFVGVCEGLGAWSGLDPVWWRVAFVATTLLWGFGMPLYAILWICMKAKAPSEAEMTPENLTPEDREIWDAVKKDMAFLDSDDD